MSRESMFLVPAPIVPGTERPEKRAPVSELRPEDVATCKHCGDQFCKKDNPFTTVVCGPVCYKTRTGMHVHANVRDAKDEAIWATYHLKFKEVGVIKKGGCW